MKVLFLDIDGVMVLDPHRGKDKGIHEHDLFFKPYTEALNHTIQSTDCEIVISSGWRRFYDLEQMREIFEWNRIQKLPIGFTQDYDRLEEEQMHPSREIEMLRCREILS